MDTQFVGDEKLFHFTGDDGDIRLVISKPDRIGHWWYELCATLRTGHSFLLDTEMHSSSAGTVTVDSVVEGWMNTILEVGSEHVPEESLPNPNTTLIFDSYYMSSLSRTKLKASGVPFSASCKPDNFKPERKFISKDVEDEPGDHESIYNELTGELFTYHYDRQKGVGKKYNLSFGFNRSTNKDKLKKYKDFIPGYSHYKVLFEPCDRFNRLLHSRHWPYKRGGRGVKGAQGNQHDFLMACILQNTFNAHHAIMAANLSQPSFVDMCNELSDQIYKFACTIFV